jgi:hypothetical protein
MPVITYEPSIGTLDDLMTAWERAQTLSRGMSKPVCIWVQFDPIRYTVRGKEIPGPEGATLLTTVEPTGE